MRLPEETAIQGLLMISTVIYGFFACSLVLLSLIVLGRKIPRIWLLVWGLSPVILVYALNPDFRVYSFHSFMHGGIVYQILNGNIPPPDPLVAGHAAHYPWGFHLLAAGLSRLLGVSPFISMALLNIISLLIVMVLIYKISQLLIVSRRAGILAVIGAVFGSTPVIPELLKMLPDNTPTEIRGIPILHKFISINPLPIGLALFLLAVYAAIRLFQGKRLVVNTLWVAGSTLATGFVYPAFLPGIAAGGGLGFVVIVALRAAGRGRSGLRMAILTVAALAVAGIILRPYLTSIGSGTVSNMDILNRRSIVANLTRWVTTLGPVTILIVLNLRQLAVRLDPRGLLAVAVVAAASAGVYLAIHLPFNNEYKLLLISMVMLGLLGGLAFDSMLERYRRPAVLALAILFIIPALRVTWLRAVRGRKVPSTYVERGMNTDPVDSEEAELYRWIRTNTVTNSIFIDSGLEVPVLGRRRLFIPAPGRGRQHQKGFGMIRIILTAQSGYDAELIDRRIKIVDRLYDTYKRLRPQDVEELHALGADVYAISRDTETAGDLESRGFLQVFSSPGGNRVYLLPKDG
jgi:hypothetical protein